MPELSLSTEAQKLKSMLQKSWKKGKVVNYNFDFLNKYRPNATYYLDDATRYLLRKAGYIRQRFCSYSQKFVLDLSYHSSRLEGSSLSLIETKHLLSYARMSSVSGDKKKLLVINHREAINFLLEAAKDMGVSSYSIRSIHQLLSRGLLNNPLSCGQLRLIPIEIGKTDYMPLRIPQTIQEYFDKIIEKSNQIKDPIEQSFFLMVHLPYLQPFEDVNKRTSRLAANIPLIKNDLCPFSFADVSKEEYMGGFLGVYLYNNVSLFSDVYKWGYLRSCDLYGKSMQSRT